MMIFLAFFANFFIFVASFGYNCPATSIVSPPIGPNQPFYFPANWNEEKEPPIFNASQSCNWKVSVPQGTYATVVFYKNTQIFGSYATVTYPNTHEYSLGSNDTAPYIFTSPQFQVALEAKEDEGTFAFKIVWNSYPSDICSTKIQLDSSSLIPSPPSLCATTYTAPHRVWLVGFTQQFVNSDYLRQSAVFEGDSMDGKYIGNLYDAAVWNIGSQGKSVTVYTFGIKMGNNRTLFLGMDTSVIIPGKRFIGLDCPVDSLYGCSISSYSDDKVNAVITASRDVDYVESVKGFPDNGNVTIYEGKIDEKHVLARISKDTFKSQLPIAVKSTVKIYQFDSTSVYFPLSHQRDDAKWGEIYTGSHVTIHSFDYGQDSIYQDTFETFETAIKNGMVKFNLNVPYFDGNGNSTLEIEIFRFGASVFYGSYSSKNRPPGTQAQVVGSYLTVKYQTYGQSTKGFEVDLVCTENDEIFSSSSPDPSDLPPTVSISTTGHPDTTTKASSRHFFMFFVLFVEFFWNL